MGTEQGTEISVLGKFGSVLGFFGSVLDKICPGLVTDPSPVLGADLTATTGLWRTMTCVGEGPWMTSTTLWVIVVAGAIFMGPLLLALVLRPPPLYVY